MFTDLTTERLLLRCISYDDAEFFFREFSDEDVKRYLYDADPCASEDEAKEWISFYLDDEPRDHRRWIIVLRKTGEKIGTCGFHCWNREEGTVEMGYDLQPQYWRRGYASEAIREILAFAARTMQVRTVHAHISVDNSFSARLAEKLGFVRSGEQYNEVFHGTGYLHDIYCQNLSEK